MNGWKKNTQILTALHRIVRNTCLQLLVIASWAPIISRSCEESEEVITWNEVLTIVWELSPISFERITILLREMLAH
jgi:hypothetical protein